MSRIYYRGAKAAVLCYGKDVAISLSSGLLTASNALFILICAAGF